MHAKLYKRSVLEKYNIKFNSCRNHEDNAYNKLFELYAEKIIVIKGDPIYLYNYNPKSLTNFSIKKREDVINYINSMTWLMREIKRIGILNRSFDNKIANLICRIMFYTYHKAQLVPELSDFVYSNTKLLKTEYNRYSSLVSEETKGELFNWYGTDVIPKITFYEFMNNIKE